MPAQCEDEIMVMLLLFEIPCSYKVVIAIITTVRYMFEMKTILKTKIS